MAKRIKVSDIKQAPHRHPPFSEGRLNAIQQIKGLVDEVYPQTVDKWEDSLRRDSNPDGELRAWLHLGKCYAEHAANFPAGSEQREDIFRLLVQCSLMPPTPGTKLKVPHSLTPEQFQLLLVDYFWSPEGD